MRLLNRCLIVLLALAALAAAAVNLPSRGTAGDLPPAPAHLPAALGGWVRSPGAPEDILPEDPRARRSERWTYRKGTQEVWVTVGLYGFQNHPLSRPTLDRIVQRRGVSALDQEARPVSLDGAGGPPVEVNRLAVTRGGTRVEVTYWYQLGRRTIASEYRFRLAFFLNTLLGRDERLGLVRVAAGGESGGGVLGPGATEDFLRAAGPALVRTVAN